MENTFVTTYMSTATVKGLNYFCRTNFLENWINIDPRVPREMNKMVLAGGKFVAMNHSGETPLPFPDETYKNVYIGIDFQQLTLNVAETLLKDVYRVLEPGGHLRLFTHNLINIFRGIVEEKQDLAPVIEVAKQFIKHPATSPQSREMLAACLRYENVPSIWFNSIFFGLGYHFIYDYDSLSALCEHAGFSRSKMRRAEFQQSELPDIALLESQPLPYQDRALYLEIQK